ncbi:MAG: pseudoazurin [Pseudomonadales bacterium]|nr:pseudoazurin [Pseudomonadales bacterium]NRA17024.1 pseudoazurin [Oceanospirillaceae bacterium]
MKKKFLGGVLVACLAASLSTTAFAAEHTVLMLNGNATGVMVFEPALINVEVGDTVTFVAKDMGHNAETVSGLAPDGAASFKGELSKPVTFTVDKEGVYVVQCNPHSIMAMVGVIVAGAPTNLADIQAKAATYSEKFVMNKERLSQILAQIK